ncbi:MAG: RNA polymerase sigma factor [Bacteroidetes bacterium]|nr:RNA polymerase sigma factor [Bacteroidota bacterium]MDA0875062.1 RNA polymerase sigma factor [Bacteroidota bacterium]
MNPLQFKSLVDLHRDRVYSYVLHMLRDPAASADVTQDVFIRLWEYRGALEEERVLSWLLRVARNACIDQMRKHRVRLSVENDEVSGIDLLEDDSPTPEGAARASLFRDRLQEALDRLGEPHRSIVILREIEGYPYNDISDQLGLPLNTVKVYLHRARKALRHHLGEVHRHDYA